MSLLEYKIHHLVVPVFQPPPCNCTSLPGCPFSLETLVRVHSASPVAHPVLQRDDPNSPSVPFWGYWLRRHQYEDLLSPLVGGRWGVKELLKIQYNTIQYNTIQKYNWDFFHSGGVPLQSKSVWALVKHQNLWNCRRRGGRGQNSKVLVHILTKCGVI